MDGTEPARPFESRSPSDPAAAAASRLRQPLPDGCVGPGAGVRRASARRVTHRGPLALGVTVTVLRLPSRVSLLPTTPARVRLVKSRPRRPELAVLAWWSPSAAAAAGRTVTARPARQLGDSERPAGKSKQACARIQGGPPRSAPGPAVRRRDPNRCRPGHSRARGTKPQCGAVAAAPARRWAPARSGADWDNRRKRTKRRVTAPPLLRRQAPPSAGAGRAA